MLIKIKDFDISTPAAATITLSIMNDNNTASSLVQAEFEAINLETYFLVKNDTKSKTIDLATVVPNFATGIVTLTFDSTATDNAVVNGDLLTVERGTVRIPVSGTGILNTATYLYNEAGDGTNLSTDAPTITDSTLIAPSSNYTGTALYQVLVDIVDMNGTTISLTPVALSTPFKVADGVVARIQLTKNFDEATVFAVDAKVAFKVAYFDALDEPLSISTSDNVSISAYAKKQFA